ncbi:MAG: class I SAM-dependent methyltransferase [Parcubacteria group bacterium]|nr:class I SAM-dependent methyltransferase [Parcubacteria group bacterium]
MLIANDWKDYILLDSGDGEKLEQWNTIEGGLVVARPDPQVLWPKEKPELWNSADGTYIRREGGGHWNWKDIAPTGRTLSYKNLKFLIKPTDFKHMGLFPEQAVNWDWMMELIHTSKRPIKILNLFAYTGAATVACLSASAEVCHVDASKGMTTWAKQNVALNGLEDKPVRYIVDDVLKFVKREIKRGMKYDAIIMDPPPFGRGAQGEVWKIEKMLYPLTLELTKLLSDQPLFFLINSYAGSCFSPIVLQNVLNSALGSKGKTESHELCLSIKNSANLLPTGVCARWTTK